MDILQKNQEKLMTFLSNFHNDRTGKWKHLLYIFFCQNSEPSRKIDDEQFNEEKAFLMKSIENLKNNSEAAQPDAPPGAAAAMQPPN